MFNFENLQEYDISIRALTLNHASTYIASVKYFQPNLNKLTTWPAHREVVRGLDFSPDDAQFATAIDDYRTHMILRGESKGMNPYQPGMGGQMRCTAPNDGRCVRQQGQSDQVLGSLSWNLAHNSVCIISHSAQWRRANTLIRCALDINHENTTRALASLHRNLLAATSRDHTVRVFGICSMKEWVVLPWHKKGVGCTSYLPLLKTDRTCHWHFALHSPDVAPWAPYSRL